MGELSVWPRRNGRPGACPSKPEEPRPANVRPSPEGLSVLLRSPGLVETFELVLLILEKKLRYDRAAVSTTRPLSDGASLSLTCRSLRKASPRVRPRSRGPHWSRPEPVARLESAYAVGRWLAVL